MVSRLQSRWVGLDTSLTATKFGSTLSVITKWAEALHGASSLDDVVAGLLPLVGADAGGVSRIAWRAERQRRIAQASASKARSGRRRARAGYALDVFGGAMRAAQAGSVWSMNEVKAAEPDLVSRISDADLREHGVREILVICLEVRDDEFDVLELVYRNLPAEHNQALIEMLGPEFSTAWRRRLPGTAQKHQARNHRRQPVPQQPEMAILHPDNPAGLSRCEFRICVMLHEGMRVDAIAEALSIGRATVRSHLSKIYQKTQTTGQVELVQRFLRDDLAEQPERRSA